MKLKIKDKLYSLPNTSELWKDKFSSYIDDETICFSDTSLNNRYIMTNEMFNCIYNDIAQLGIGDEEAIDIGKNIRDIDNLQNFINKKGNQEKAVELLEKAIIIMLDYNKEKENIQENSR